jgi:hypothetical protein
MVADFSPTHTAEKLLRAICASAIGAMGLLVIDAAHFVFGLQIVPAVRFVGVKIG